MNPPRLRTMAAIVVLVVAGHAWLLEGVVRAPAGAVGASRPVSHAALIDVRWLAEPVAASARRSAAAVAGAEAASRQQRVREVGGSRPLSAPRTRDAKVDALRADGPSVIPASAFDRVAAHAARASASVDGDPQESVTAQEGAAAQPSGLPPAQTAWVAQVATPTVDSPVQPAPEAVDVPTYRTRLPAAMHLSYQLRRGMLTGTGDFDWKPDGGRYEMRLDGKVAGFSVLSWVSQGGFDAAGLAPVRYTDQRRNKQTLAANFQRGQGVITYSQPQVEYPLVPGAQDRLSWLIQLPSILSADPSLGKAGTHVSMFVTGARGDADVWSFRVVAREPVATPGGTIDAIHLLREARKPHDTQVDVWLDPQRGFLPVHAQMANEGGGDAFELSLR